ncbi:citrate transporter-like domain-containing protein [Piptocephalis cylindrospora]|uniref:Citrate transporter-like domain-containing protein n=1 Tax=Piptocephalis cylindrospora TaxID=1907219 RepID=A0A4P9Y4F3_9FUNG|nr:citrate transporter-like domain-containing protein [Piptocephalis cylindrospora]|eukprot:RKP13634.1 citrate transporter-like domain-containing protein [Piptocephalis cylindrospora]
MPPNALISLAAQSPPPNHLNPIQETVAVITFFLCWLLIARSWPIFPVGRNAAAILGGCIMVTIGVITAEQAFASISGGTILLLSGLMLILGRLEDKGLIPWLNVVFSFPPPPPPLAPISSLSFPKKMNDGSAIFLTGVIVSICEDNDLEVEPFALALATSANIGSAATVIGNPKNMIIQEQIPGTSFTSFFLSMAPAAYLGTILNTMCLCWHYRDRLPRKQLRYREVSQKRLSGRIHSGVVEGEGVVSPSGPPSTFGAEPWTEYDDDDEASLRRRLDLGGSVSEDDSDDDDSDTDDEETPDGRDDDLNTAEHDPSETSPLLKASASSTSASARPLSHDLSWGTSKPSNPLAAHPSMTDGTFPRGSNRRHRPSLRLPGIAMVNTGSNGTEPVSSDDDEEAILHGPGLSQRPIPMGQHGERLMLPDSQYFDQGSAHSLSLYSRSVPGRAGPTESTMDPTSWLLRDVGSPRHSHYLVDPSIPNLTDSTRYPERRRHSHLEAFPHPSLPTTPDTLGHLHPPGDGHATPESGDHFDSSHLTGFSIPGDSMASSGSQAPRLSWHPPPSLDPIPSSRSSSPGDTSHTSASGPAVNGDGVASFPPPHFHSQSQPFHHLSSLIRRHWPLSLQDSLFALIILGMYIGFACRMHLGFTCLTAAMLILCLDRQDPTRHIANSINYPLLAYLFGIFVLISGVRQTRIPDGMWKIFQPLVHNGTRWIEAISFTFLICVLSFIFTSIPAVLLVAPRIDGLSGWEDQAWLLLAWSVTLCGNWTSFGSVAGLVVSELCREYSERPGSKDRWIGEFSVWVSFSWWSTLLILFSGMVLIMIQ